jgi:dihydroorotase-like cyclic amidohydrolase
VSSDLVVRAGRLIDGRVVDVVVRSGRIESLTDDLGSAISPGTMVIDADGRLVTPSFVVSETTQTTTFHLQGSR